MNFFGYCIVGAALFVAGKYLFSLKGELLSALVIFLTFIIAVAVDQFGECVPGSWFERHRYTAEIWATACPDENKTQNARVRALIEADDDEKGGGYRYRLMHFTFSRGQRVSFEDNDRALLKFASPCSVMDDEKHWWTITIRDP
jgi:hypothetical protein